MSRPAFSLKINPRSLFMIYTHLIQINFSSTEVNLSPEINSAYGVGVTHSLHLCLSGYISDVPERNFMLWGSFESLSFGL